jgi:hypothetical protein
VDEDGNPVARALVSINGIGAAHATRDDGTFTVSDDELRSAELVRLAGASTAAANVLEIAVLAPGFTPYVATFDVQEGALVNVDLVHEGLEPALMLSGPEDGKLYVIPQGCGTAEVDVSGFASLGIKENFRLDVAVVIDRSGSTSAPAMDVDGDGVVDSVLDAEVAAVRCFIEGLDPATTRVALFQFNDIAGSVAEFTSDLEAVQTSLAAVGPSGGGTNFEAAFLAAEDAFVALEQSDAITFVPAEESDTGLPRPSKAVVFISDGIVTSHGVPRDFMDSNITQSSADRAAAIQAAGSLGAASGAQLFAYSIIPADDANRKRTTLPHCVSACGGGEYENIEDPTQLASAICGKPLSSLLSVEIENLSLGGPPVAAQLRADGSFAEPVAVGAGSPEDANADGSFDNVIQVTLTAFSGPELVTLTKSVTVRVFDAVTYDLLNHNEIETAQAAALPVSQIASLIAPTGSTIADPHLRDFLVGADAGEFEDAVELFGVQTFTALDSTNPSVTVAVDFVSKYACYKSDVGYFVIDPSHPPHNAAAALSGAVTLFNTGSFAADSCQFESIAAGSAQFQFTVPSGTVLGFFLLPDGTLASYKKSKKATIDPIFTLNALNPGNFDQAMSFKSELGRTPPGASGTVVTPGPTLIFAFEDLATASRTSDQDFNDVIITVRAVGLADLEETACTP